MGEPNSENEVIWHECPVCMGQGKIGLKGIASANTIPLPVSAQQGVWTRCEICKGSGLIEGGYCKCELGRDLERVEASGLRFPEYAGGESES